MPSLEDCRADWIEWRFEDLYGFKLKPRKLQAQLEESYAVSVSAPQHKYFETECLTWLQQESRHLLQEARYWAEYYREEWEAAVDFQEQRQLFPWESED